MNTYIQDKLDDTFRQIGQIGSIHPEIVDEFILLKNQSLTDYHNHIIEMVEKFRNQPIDANEEMKIGIELVTRHILKYLQDTNPKK